jgi:hypothetical protein
MFGFRTAGHRKPLQDYGYALSIREVKLCVLSFLIGREYANGIVYRCDGNN